MKFFASDIEISPCWEKGIAFLRWLREFTEHSVATEIGLPELLQVMPEAMRDGEPQAIVGYPIELQGASHLHLRSISHEDERDVVQGVRIALA
jgi:hypothetical protein